jgi:glutamate transport system substrate-binding protein
MRGTIRRMLTAAVALTALATATGCSSGEINQNPSVVPGATPGGSLRIGISFDQPGLGMKDGDTYTGFDVDTATYVAKSLGVPAEGITWIEADPGNRESLLSSGAVDLVFSTYSITDERKQKVDFAGPYFLAHQDLLVRRNEEEITGPETLDNRILCSVAGTTSAALVKEKFKGTIDLREYSKFSDCVAALDRSEVDAVTTDDVILAGFAAEPKYRGKLKVVGDGFSDESYGVGVKKGDADMVEKVNTALKAYIDDGSWKASLNQTVRPSGYKIPKAPTPGS